MCPSQRDQPVVIDQRYEIVRRIARGGMSQVYVAHDRRLQRDVALKVMHPYLAESEEFVRLFRREARAAARLSHPGVVAVYDQGNTGDSFYLTMEYIRGGNLRDLLERDRTLTLAHALTLTEQILSALAAAHRADLVHRDIKPENILLLPDGDVKVADFGLARAVSEASMSGTGTVLGTVAYLAPEVVTEGQSSPAADVYSVGILLYEMICGLPPYVGERPIQVAYRHVNEDVPAPSDSAPWVPTEVDDLLAALTARDLADREPDAGTALEHLRRIRADLDPQTLDRRHELPGADTAAPVTAQQTQQIAHSDTAAVPLTHTTRVRTGPRVGVPVGAVTEAPAASPAPRSRRRWPLILLTALVVFLAAGTAWWFTLGPGIMRELPNLAGMSEAAAVDAVRASELRADVVREHDDDVEEGLVVSSEPGPGALRKGSTVKVLVSKGILTITTPDLVGEETDVATAALADAGGTVGAVTSEYSDTVAQGRVISASREAGDVIAHNEPVDLVVSDGPEPVEVPDVVEKKVDKAIARLQEDGLQATQRAEFSDDVDEGEVISQSPQGGAAAHRTDTVELVVSKGPETFPVPDVFGKQVEEAEEILDDAGFDVEVERILGGIFGTVRSQNPEPGTLVPKGTTIKLSVV